MVLRWVEGQHPIALETADDAVSLELDLGARFDLSCPTDLDGDAPLLSIRHGDWVTVVRADGAVVASPWRPKDERP
jgi:hypothetical protein